MKCPKCNQTLVMSERQGVEIDYCPECRGVWLDRGELDKILERSGGNDSRPDEPRRDDEYSRRGHAESQAGFRKRRGGFLSELFDFGD
jgi:Zn-finger nucleic acid-binding protein